MATKWAIVTIRNTKAAISTRLYHPPSDDDPKTIASNLRRIFDFRPHDPQFKAIEVSSGLVDDITLDKEKMIKVVFENNQSKPSQPYRMTLYHEHAYEYQAVATRIEQIISRKILVLPSDSPIKVTATEPENA